MKNILFLFTLLLIQLHSIVCADAISWENPPEYSIGLEGNEFDTGPLKVSANGRYLLYLSYASNLVLQDSNQTVDLFWHDSQTGENKLISTTASEEQFIVRENTLLGSGEYRTDEIRFSEPTDDGRYVAFSSDGPDLPLPSVDKNFQLYIKDVQNGDVITPLFNGVPIQAARGFNISISADGRYVYFSTLTALVGADTNTELDAYIMDRDDQSFELMSIGSSGVAEGGAYISMSQNQRYVIFFSSSNEMISGIGDFEGRFGFVRDLQTATTSVFSIDESGDPVINFFNLFYNSAVSDSGVVYFCSFADEHAAEDVNELADIYVYDSGQIALLDFPGVSGLISDDGCNGNDLGQIFINSNEDHLYFMHASDEILNTNAVNVPKIISLDLNNNQMTLVNEAAGVVFDVQRVMGVSQNHETLTLISDRAEFALGTQTANPKIYSHNRSAQTTVPVSAAAFVAELQNEEVRDAIISDDFQWLVYASTANNILPPLLPNDDSDVYLKNRSTGELSLIAYDALDLGMSPDGRYITFSTDKLPANPSVVLDTRYVFLFDRLNSSYLQIAPGFESDVNDDGNVVFYSRDDNLVNNDNNGFSDVFFFDRTASSIARISESTSGGDAESNSYSPSIGGSGNSTWVVFESDADDLVANDTNNSRDIFLINWPNGFIDRISELPGGEEADRGSTSAIISSDASTIVFKSTAPNLVGAPVSNHYQVFIYDRIMNSLLLISQDESGGYINEQDFKDPGVSSDGRYVVFETDTQLRNADNDGYSDIYLYDQMTAQLRLFSDYSNDTFGHSLLGMAANANLNETKVGVLFNSDYSLINSFLNEYVRPVETKALFLQQFGGDGETLSVTFSGDGNVTGNLGLNCSSACSQVYLLGQQVTLVASASPGFEFLYWQGDACQGSNSISCPVYINGPKEVKAVFIDSSDLIFRSGFE